MTIIKTCVCVEWKRDVGVFDPQHRVIELEPEQVSAESLTHCDKLAL